VTVEPTLHGERHVLDASALLRLYLANGPLPERLEAVMERGCRGEGVLLVPDLCWLEITSVLSRQISRALLTAEEAADLLADCSGCPCVPWPAWICAPQCSSSAKCSGSACMTPPIWLWPSATGPFCSPLISNWLERLKGPAAEAEGSKGP